LIVAVLYGVIPISGAFFSRYRWERFRKRFNSLRLVPLLNYRQYREMGNAPSGEGKGGVFRFTGEIESITDGQTLWVRGSDLTMPVSLEKTQCWLLPAHEGEGANEAPEKIHWNRISTFTEGAKVFIGGQIKEQDNRLNFVSVKEKPLMVIFYNCPDTVLTDEIIRAARTRGEYWNSLTSASLVLGALALVYIAASFLNRPAFHITVIIALVAMFTPIYPMFPPGILLTVVYRRMTWHARRLRAFRDLARLPLGYLGADKETCTLTTGEKYGYVKLDSLSSEGEGGTFPFLIPEAVIKEEKKSPWYLFGVFEESADSSLPVKSSIKPSIDPFVSFGLLPENPAQLARFYSIKAYSLEALAWLVLLSGIAINIVFIFLILFLLGIVSF
jgi:hypothetical protein